MNLDWSDLLAALAIVCIIEGILPFLNPAGMKRLLSRMAQIDEREMRIFGLLSMLGGLALLYWVRS